MCKKTVKYMNKVVGKRTRKAINRSTCKAKAKSIHKRKGPNAYNDMNDANNDAFSVVKIMKRKQHRKIFLKITFAFGLAVFIAVVILFFEFFKIGEWREFDSNLILGADQSTLVYDEEGELVSVIAVRENRIPISIETLPNHVKFSFVSAEDARFYDHKGIDIVRILGAAWADIKAGDTVQGASTIGQQLIKLSHLTGEKTFERKLEEAYLSISMEHEFDKDEILEMYLNYVYFGGGFYGIETAALGYFGIHAEELSVAQAAQLAGILKAPSNYAPHLDLEKSIGRRNTVLGLMYEYGYISEAEYLTALDEECILKNAIPSERNYYIDYAVDEACEILEMERDEFLSLGFSVYTRMDGNADEICEELLSDKENYPEGCMDSVQAAIVLLRNDGSIAAIRGGSGISEEKYTPFAFNRASDMERQPGSLIKPILCYAPAMDLYGYTAATILDDTPKDFSGYLPRNPGGEYNGQVTLRTALYKSLNIPAVSILHDIGIENATSFAKRFGISFENENKSLALALGGFTNGVSPLEIAGAYSVIANGGYYRKPYAVNFIIKDGERVYSHDEGIYSLSDDLVISEETAFIITDILMDAAEKGTASVLNELGISIAAKTGTNLAANDLVRDAWAAAYTVDYTAVMWMGMDSANEGSLPKGTTGGNSACAVLSKLYSSLYREKKPENFSKPDGVISCTLDLGALEQGRVLLAADYTPDEERLDEFFIEANMPFEINDYWQYPEPPAEVGWYINEQGKPVICFSADERYGYAILRIDENGIETRLKEFFNTGGDMEYCDMEAIQGNYYIYTVHTIHPEITIDGNNAESENSRKMRILLWY